MRILIQYSLSLKNTNYSAARDIVKALHAKAEQLPVPAIQEIIEIDPSMDSICTERRLYLAVASKITFENGKWRRKVPGYVVAFAMIPGIHSECAIFGLACTLPNESRCLPGPPRIDFEWKGFCKTIEIGKKPNVTDLYLSIKAHLSVVSVLDAAAKLGFTVSVEDDSGYWQSRDVESLVIQLTADRHEAKSLASHIQSESNFLRH